MLRDSQDASRSVVVAQLGARMHYAVPRILESQGDLQTLFTDFISPGWLHRLLSRRVPSGVPSALVKAAQRVPEGVPKERIVDFKLFGLDYQRRLRQSPTRARQAEVYLSAGQQFCQLILDHGLGQPRLVYAFNSAALELLDHCHRERITAVVEQTIAPLLYESRLLESERARFPDWEQPDSSASALRDLADREAQEWRSAARVICGSDFVRNAIAETGGPTEKCVVVPYGVEGLTSSPATEPHGGPLRVLVVGAVGLRKGSPYVLEAARELKGAAIIRMVGPIKVSENVQKELGYYVELIGPIPRSQVQQHYSWADVLLLPSLCEGSATATYEALAAGLPVICTPNTGSVVRDQVDGLIVPIRDAGAIVATLERLAEDAELLHEMSRNASARAQQFTFERYSDRLTRALKEASKQ